ncbi:hypothetical protein [Tateyamaria omphalii]|uniref:Uncharacterized protein n=1 Tax=Tateyamaria omphalii TaxID=299262 RepID=A0A1P8N1Y0_9RHOB|nr:hypothetical protein [Tateyamaria omphalii]APX14311.1 hypothetical protein BWR18_20940 [Tateyamaria omphalii]
MTFRRRVVLYASSLLGPLLWATGALLVFVVGLGILFFVVHRSEVLFVIEANTSRFEYKVMHPERIEVPVRGVRVITGNKQVVVASDDKGEPDNCYSGVLLPARGTTLVFQMYQGLQQIKLAPSAEAKDTPVARLTQGYARYKIDGAETDHTASLLAPDDDPPEGFVPLSGLSTLTQDPACINGGAAFALPEEPVVIDGTGIIGRGFTPNANAVQASMRALDLEYIAGEIDIVMRENICFDRLRGRSCPNVFRLESDPVPIPASSALTGLGENGPVQMVGQAFFEDGRYVVQASMNARKLVINQPSPFNWEATQQSLLGVSWLDRILIEPLLVVSASVFLTLLGITLGVLQIEVHDELGETPDDATPASNSGPIVGQAESIPEPADTKDTSS